MDIFFETFTLLPIPDFELKIYRFLPGVEVVPKLPASRARRCLRGKVALQTSPFGP